MDRAETTKIIEDYGIVLEELSSSRQLCVYDEKHLPHPKSVIRNALYLQLREYSYEVWKQIEGGKEAYNSLLGSLCFIVCCEEKLGDGD